MGEVTAVLTLSAKDAAELGRMFQAIGRALETLDRPGEVTPAAGITDSPTTITAEWYRENGGRFVGELRDTARKALRVIVERGPLVSMDDVRAEVRLEGSALAGSLKSMGAAVRRLGAPAPPYKADHKRHQYEISPDVQEALRPHISEDDGSHAKGNA